MKIEEIKDPSFLKKLTISELNELADQIRKFLIESVSKTGGHLSSNLGVVELTIALHKVFNSPNDKLIFDVGHQSYVHKILTGRACKFNKLRQYNGLSGFQKRNESLHDCWEAGHSSTSLSAAIGMAVARDLNNQDYHIIPIIGDGALASGMSLEALNHIGSLNKQVIIIFNDNNMSISKNVGALNDGFSKLRTSRSYNAFKNDIKSSLSKNDVGKSILRSMSNIKENIKHSVVDGGIFEEFGIEYIGPINGHDIRSMIQVFEVAKKHQGPIVIHVVTKKGKGYPFCENDSQGKWHGVSSFNVSTGVSNSVLPVNHLTWSSVISETLVRLAKNDKKICAITPAMITGSKLEKFFALYPERSFDCGIAEEHAATFAAGLANNGMKPFLCIYSSFLQRCYDQINHDICRMKLPVIIGIDRAGLVGEDGDTHHGVFDISILRSLPNIVLSQPKDAIEAQNLIYTAFNTNVPFTIRYPRGAVEYHEVTNFSPIEIGSWELLNANSENQCIVITYGSDVEKVIRKAEVNNINICVVNARFFKPLDNKMLIELAAMKLPIIVYETDMLAGGLASAILEFYNDLGLNVLISRIGIKDNYVTFGATNLLRKENKIDINTLFDKIINLKG